MARRPSYHYNVYVVELSDAVWNEPSFRKANPDHVLGKPFVYVGMTGLDPALTSTRRAFNPIASCAITACACCRSCTRSITRCRTTGRGTIGTASGRHCSLSLWERVGVRAAVVAIKGLAFSTAAPSPPLPK